MNKTLRTCFVLISHSEINFISGNLEAVPENLFFFCSFVELAEKLGGKITENPEHCTHLVAPKIIRTIKFFHAINVCHHIITKEWLEESSLQNRFLGMFLCHY